MATGNQRADLGAGIRCREAEPRARAHGGLAMSPITHVPGSRIVQAGHVASSSSGEDAVLVDMQTGRRIRLDHFGSRLWQALASRPTLPSIVVAMRDEGMSAERLAEDVTRVLARWKTHRLIQWR